MSKTKQQSGISTWRRREALQVAKADQSRAERDSKLKSGFLEQFAKPIIVGIVLSVVSFIAGQRMESAKLRGQDERLSVENRRRVFVSSTQELGIYLTQWGRLRSISPAEVKISAQIAAKQQELAAAKKSTDPVKQGTIEDAISTLVAEQGKVAKRKERYIEGRDAAKDKLSGNFEQARLFFSAETAASIAAFEAFERLNGNKQMAELPPLDEWRTRATTIFEKMKEEIKDDESRLEASPLGSAIR